LSSRLMLSSGKVFKDYTLLEKYLELCSEDERVRSLPSSADIEFVKYLASRKDGTLHDFLEELSRRFLDRVSPARSADAVRSVLGMDMSGDQAAQLVSAQLAGWTLEIAEALGVIKLRYLHPGRAV